MCNNVNVLETQISEDLCEDFSGRRGFGYTECFEKCFGLDVRFCYITIIAITSASTPSRDHEALDAGIEAFVIVIVVM